jgi:C-terminal processing protease CtpA/Prc
LALATTEKGWFGLAMSIDIQGTVLNPTLNTITIQSVAPHSPAASAGLVSGDLILEIEGIVVAGAKPEPIKVAMQKAVGESLRLKLKHGSDAPRDVSLTAAAKPSQ